MAKDRPASVRVLEAQFLHVVEQVDGGRAAQDAVAVGDDAAAALGGQGEDCRRACLSGRMSLKMQRPMVVVMTLVGGDRCLRRFGVALRRPDRGRCEP